MLYSKNNFFLLIIIIIIINIIFPKNIDFCIHGVYKISLVGWNTYPKENFSFDHRYQWTNYSWSGHVNPDHRFFYSKKFYNEVDAKINKIIHKNDTINFYCHSHGGNVLLNNENEKFINQFLSKCKKNNIHVNYFLFETPVLPKNELTIGKLLEKYPETISIKTYVGGNDITQIYDIISNFPMCNRFLNFNKDYFNLKQYKVSLKNNKKTYLCYFKNGEMHRVPYKNNKKIYHNDLKDFYNEAKTNNHLYKVEIPNIGNRSFLNKIFFYYGRKIILLSTGILIYLKYQNTIKNIFKKSIQKIKNLFKEKF